MIQFLLFVSDSMGERFFVGAIEGVIGSVIVYFWLRFLRKKEKKQYEKVIKEEIYHDSSYQTTASNNTIEVDYYNTLYDELKEKCNPANYMNPYNAEKVEISNLIYSQLDNNRNNISALIELRNDAINKLGLPFSAKELFDKLSEVYNPNSYVGDKYNPDKLHVANQVYAKIQSMSDDIVGLENLAKENGIIIKAKSSPESNSIIQFNQKEESNVTDSKDVEDDDKSYYIIWIVIGIAFLYIVLGTCGGNNVSQSNDLLMDSVEVVDSMAVNNDTTVSELPTNTFSNGVYSIQYPKDWVVTHKNSDITDVYIKSTDSDISLQIIHYNTDKSLDDIQDILDANFIESGFDIVEKQKLSIGGQNAFGRVYFKINKNGNIMNDDTGIALMVYNLKRNDILYHIKFYNCVKRENEENVTTPFRHSNVRYT